MHPTKRQIKYYIFYCITQLIVWFCWSSEWNCHRHPPTWCGLYISRDFTFTSAVLIPFLLGLLIFSVIFLPFYIRREGD